MKRFLLAGLLAITIHGLFFGFAPGPVQRKPPQKPHIITISLASYHPVKPKPAAKPPRITQERPSRKPPEKKQIKAISPLPVKKIPKAPRKMLQAKEDAVKHPEKAMRPQKKKTKPQKRVPKPERKTTKPKAKPKAPNKTVTASLVPEKKMVPLTPPQSNRVSRPTKADPSIPIKEAVNLTQYPVPLPDIPEDRGVERGTKLASIPPVKVVREARPAYKVNPPPPYPKRAKRRGYEGTVLLEVLVDRSGRVKELRMLTSSGHPVLDRAALKSVNGWLFEPGMVGDEKVDMWVRIPVRFELRGG